MDIKQEILDSIDILLDKKISDLKFDKTVKGIVQEILSDNYYIISISGVSYKLKYKRELLSLNSAVYVLIPNNDYKNMFILCKVEK